MLGTDRIIHAALGGYPAAWFAPNYRYLMPIWRTLKEALRPVITKISEVEKRLELLGGGSIEMWTLDGPDPALGRKYRLIVVDEAAMVADLQYKWEKCLEPTLLDLAGSVWFLSTPKGLNFFHTLYQRGQDKEFPDWASHKAPTVANPTIKGIATWVEKKRRTTDSRTFTQEYEAEFLSFEGAVFRNVAGCATAIEQQSAIEGHGYVMGVDFGRSNDYTVCAIYDLSLDEIVALDRYTGVDFATQRTRIAALAQRFDVDVILAESNSIGQPNLEQLQCDGLPVRPFATTAASKPVLIDRLALALETIAIGIIPDPVLQAELLAFEGKKTPSGHIQYSAPSGQHDDCVIAVALALHAAEKCSVQLVEIESLW